MPSVGQIAHNQTFCAEYHLCSGIIITQSVAFIANNVAGKVKKSPEGLEHKSSTTAVWCR